MNLYRSDTDDEEFINQIKVKLLQKVDVVTHVEKDFRLRDYHFFCEPLQAFKGREYSRNRVVLEGVVFIDDKHRVYYYRAFISDPELFSMRVEYLF